VNGPLDEIL
jgi:hypothetical protein